MIRSFVRSAFFLLALATAAPALAQGEPESDDPLLGERLIEGAATSEHLWLRNDLGAVVEFRRSDGARRVLATEGVVDMVRSGGRLLLGVRRIAERPPVFQVFELTTGAPVSPRIISSASPIALFAESGLTLLTERALLCLDGDTWRRQALSRPLRSAPQISLTSNSAGAIYVGYNRGEWGGGMQAIDPATGTVSEILLKCADGGHDCFGRDQVTGLDRETGRPDCILVSVGLIHFLAAGRILRVCGTEAEVVFHEAIPPPNQDEDYVPNAWPFFGLTSTRDGWVAVSPGAIFRSSDGVVAQSEMPQSERWRGLELTTAGNLLILPTDVNWGMSVSGFTPLLVPIAE